MADATTLGTLLEYRTESEGDALRAPGDPDRSYDGRALLTSARKTGNFLRHLGVVPGRTVAVADVPVPESLLSLFGTALLGATTRFVSLDGRSIDSTASAPIDARALIAPTERLGVHELAPGGTRVGYGRPPEDPTTSHFEREMWSENPTFPPSEATADDPVLATADREYTHRTVLRTATALAKRWAFDDGVEVAVRAPLTDPRTVVAGILAPLACGGTVLLPDTGACGDGAVVPPGVDAPEPTVIDLEDVPIEP